MTNDLPIINSNSQLDDNTPVGADCKLKAGLYVVATPIGNLKDITLRALEVLEAADVVMCEDTRVTDKLLRKFGLKAKMYPYNDYNGDKIRPKVMDKLAEGKVVALVSDAGTPLISDPGYKLVKEVQDEGYYVTTLPGASSVIAALTLAGLPTNRFVFEGFLPPKQKARAEALHNLKTIDGTLVLLERASRVPALLPELLEILGDREIAVARELTKTFEEVLRRPISEMIAYYADAEAPRGEVVLVIAPPHEDENNEQDLDDLLKKTMSEMRMKEAVAVVAEQLGMQKKQVYARALELKDES
jgi:16S rRNA (cytidine1402-2'-O)-methyltransferase